VASLLIGPMPPPMGGIATHVASLARALRQAGIDVTTSDPRGAGRVALIPALVEARLRSQVVHLHTNGHNPGSWRLTTLVARTAGPKLLTLHSGLCPSFLSTVPSALRVRLARIASRYDRVIVVSEPIREALRQLGVAQERLLMLSPFSSAQLAIRVAPAQLGPLRRAGAILLGAQASAQPEYGIDLLLDALAPLRRRLPQARLILWGEPLPARLRRALTDPRSVVELGPLGHAEVLAVLTRLDLFVRPTRADGDSLSVREALALCRAVVASDASPRPVGTHLFRSDDTAALLEALCLALRPPGEERVRSLEPDPLQPLVELHRSLGAQPL
jgi:glycosyltransferase involved in cell wall biosynthesis